MPEAKTSTPSQSGTRGFSTNASPTQCYRSRVMAKKLSVGVIGATGMVGQRYVSLLADHPWFELRAVAASPASAGKPYRDAVGGRWVIPGQIPARAADLIVGDAGNVETMAAQVDFVFCAVDLPKAETAKLEEAYARAE